MHLRRADPPTTTTRSMSSSSSESMRKRRIRRPPLRSKQQAMLAAAVLLLLLLLTYRPDNGCLAKDDRRTPSRRGPEGGGVTGGAASPALLLASNRQSRSNPKPPSVPLPHPTTSSASSSAARDEPLLKSFLRAKCGPTGAAVWAYQGRLVDPLNGLTIANVQGVELVRCLAVTDPSGAQRERFKRRAGDLAIASTLASAAASPNLEYAGTLLSRKLFCYTSPNNPSGLLRKVRLRPTSPERSIPVSQAATVYDTATTFCQVSSPNAANANANAAAASSGGGNTLWALHTEYSDGRALWTTTNVQDDDLQKVLEFTVYARPQPLWKQRLDWKRWLGPAASASTTTTTSSSSSVVSPKRSALVQFGGSAGSDAVVGKFGARETYQYSTAFGRCSCRYSRYGEGPAWYGPGRLCTLELSGRRVEAWAELPSQIAQLVHERVVGFLSVNAPVPQDDVLAARAVQVFRGKGAAQLQIAPVDRDDTTSSRGDSFLGWQRGWNRALSAWDRVRSATSVSLGGGSSSGSGSRRSDEDDDDDDDAGRRRRRQRSKTR
jgi:hypothetical protein